MTRTVNVLGQAIIKYNTPQHLLDEINKIYDERKARELPATNKFLAGKIKSEHTLYHNEMNDPSKNFNNVSKKSLDWFQDQFQASEVDFLGSLAFPLQLLYKCKGKSRKSTSEG